MSCVVRWASLCKYTVRAVSHFDWHGRGRGAGRVLSAGPALVSAPTWLSIIIISGRDLAQVVSTDQPALVSTPS